MVSFGVAPALVAFSWSLQDLGKVGWIAAFMYVAGAALRLARFNTQLGTADKNFYRFSQPLRRLPWLQARFGCSAKQACLAGCRLADGLCCTSGGHPDGQQL